ncbi:MAG: EpsI family protein [Rubrivivax sp.]|nr:EpsI family protein [Rubrivivax sp.]
MQAIHLRHLIIGLAMLGAAGLALALTPREKMADQGLKVNLEAMIPKQFGEWKVDETIVPLQVSPDVQATLDTIYNQILSRTYINGAGQRVMLSIAYGGMQSKSLQVHRPEVCYAAQGFEIFNKAKSTVQVGSLQIPVMRVLAKQGERVEPITYWIRFGDRIVRGNIELGLARFAAGIEGTIPDGLLFRVSMISKDAEKSAGDQDRFIRELMGSLSPNAQKQVLGKLAD